MGEESLPGMRREVCFTFSTGVGSSSNLQLQHSRAVLPGTCLATCCQKLRWLGCTVRYALCRAALCSAVHPASGLLDLPLVEGCWTLPSLLSCGAVLGGPDAPLPLGGSFCLPFSSFTWEKRRHCEKHHCRYNKLLAQILACGGNGHAQTLAKQGIILLTESKCIHAARHRATTWTQRCMVLKQEDFGWTAAD